MSNESINTPLILIDATHQDEIMRSNHTLRAYVPKVPYPIPPRHLYEPFNEEKLGGFNKMVKQISPAISFKDACDICPLFGFSRNYRQTQEEIKTLFIKARSSSPSLKQQPKIEDPRKFVVPCSITGVQFEDSLCDSESSVKLISKAIAEKLGIVDMRPS